ncbi:MAG: 4Fe-4S dicluster domain-containing protein [Desulfosarcina sp.]|nr:4Fe-4S dicluster domain-containing protein [Desulfosarcina sp.]MBC2742317.1 4Fe-4S dicluster domain-containing protein [Desulfosarcina sp.]MBC2765228.1 heterodisulfide reductase subunit C [Desulfosarcina sp.]
MKRLHLLSLQQTCDKDFIHRVEKESGQQVSKCYQCGNCSASCNYTYVYDYPVNQIMRLIQLGQKDVVLQARSVWLCANCQACSTRCPCNIDVARVMESLRIISVEEGMVSKKKIKLFYDEFLSSVKKHGRVFETGLIAAYNIKALKPFTDADLGARVLKKGKLELHPHNIKGRKDVAEIFNRFEAYSKNRDID